MKLKICVFVKKSNTGKAKLSTFCLLPLILLILKDATLWLWHDIMPNLIQKICTKPYWNLPRFVKDMTKTFWCVFSVHNSNCYSLAKRDCYVSKGRVETPLRWGGKRLHFCTTNLLRIICTKLYHNRSGFVDYNKKHFGVFFSSQCIYLNKLNTMGCNQENQQWRGKHSVILYRQFQLQFLIAVKSQTVLMLVEIMHQRTESRQEVSYVNDGGTLHTASAQTAQQLLRHHS